MSTPSPLDLAMLRAQSLVLTNTGKHVGAQRALADILDVAPQAVSQWAKKGFAPTDRAVQIETLLGIPRRDLIDPALLELIDAPRA